MLRKRKQNQKYRILIYTNNKTTPNPQTVHFKKLCPQNMDLPLLRMNFFLMIVLVFQHSNLL